MLLIQINIIQFFAFPGVGKWKLLSQRSRPLRKDVFPFRLSRRRVGFSRVGLFYDV